MDILEKDYDVIVVGGGIAGLAAALGAIQAEKENKVLLLEKNAELGKNIRGELIYDDEEILEILFPKGLPLHLINIQIATARYYSPSTKNYYERIYVRNKISIEYRFLIQELTKLVLRKGCKICLKANVTEIKKVDEVYSVIRCKFNDKSYHIRAKCIICADGTDSSLRDLVGLKNLNSIYPMIKTIVENINLEDKNRLEFFLTVDPPGVIWIFPKSASSAEVGYSIFTDFAGQQSYDLEELFFNYWESYPIFKDRVRNAGIVYRNLDKLPFGGPNKENYVPNVMFVGDAMGQVGAVGGSGIISSMSIGYLTGNFLANSIDGLDSEVFLKLNDIVKKSDIGKYLKKEMKNGKLFRNLVYETLGTSEQIDENWEKIRTLMTSRE